MVAKVKTSKLFDGKIYAKSRPNLCVQDISNSLEFEIGMKYHDVNCDVKETAAGHFSSDIVIQHHDMIVTTKDLGLSIHCKYDLSNRSITNNVNLAVDGYEIFLDQFPFFSIIFLIKLFSPSTVMLTQQTHNRQLFPRRTLR